MSATPTARPRLAPLQPPYDPDLARTLERMMPPGMEPLKLFQTVAHNHAMLDKFRSTGSYLLNFGTVPAIDREIVIERTCARCDCEYEWGVHAAFYGVRVGLTEAQLVATASGAAADPAWSQDQSLLVELVALLGQYHFVSFIANAFAVELEPIAMRFPGRG